MGSFSVDTPVLEMAAESVARASDAAYAAASLAGCQAPAGFDDGPMTATVADLLHRAEQSFSDMSDTLTQLKGNLAVAAIGYVATDKGMLQVALWHGTL